MKFLKRLWPAFAVVAVLAMAGLLWWADTTRNDRPNFGDLPTWLTFAAAALGVPFALYQLRLQRRQLAQQQKTIEDEFARQQKRDELLDIQLKEARRSARILERQQAEAIDLKPDVMEGSHMAKITNRSPRPIWDVVCVIEPVPGQGTQPASEVGEFIEHTFGPLGETVTGLVFDETRQDDRQGVARAGSVWGFVFGASFEGHPDARMSVTFADDAGMRWRIDHDLHLQPAEGQSGASESESVHTTHNAIYVGYLSVVSSTCAAACAE